MPPRKTARQKADEAYLRTMQIDLEEQIAQETRSGPISSQEGVGPIEEVSVVPSACPRCGEGVQTGRPTIFTHLLKREGGPHRIQCGNCAETIWCSEAVWLEVKKANAARFGGADVKPVKKQRATPKDRGLE